ncbi:MAG: hypothetical protein JXB47_00810 [Anaerolineae bacterium]|nr:hypothetical protein [Anaerolineae bacterium]
MHRLYTETLRHIATQLGLPPLRDVVKAPGVNEALRLTILYARSLRRAPDQVATLTGGHAGAWLEVAYLVPGAPRHGRIPFDPQRFREIVRQLLQLGFDRLDDQPSEQLSGDVWLLERAAVHYHRDMVLVPGVASGVYLALIDRVRALWPEALRDLGEY